jgi:hypothetical protein
MQPVPVPPPHTHTQALVSGQFSHSCWAGPRYSGGRPSTWWSLDLGPGHRLAPNYYVLRQDGSNDFPRHWVLQVGGWGRVWLVVLGAGEGGAGDGRKTRN